MADQQEKDRLVVNFEEEEKEFARKRAMRLAAERANEEIPSVIAFSPSRAPEAPPKPSSTPTPTRKMRDTQPPIIEKVSTVAPSFSVTLEPNKPPEPTVDSPATSATGEPTSDESIFAKVNHADGEDNSTFFEVGETDSELTAPGSPEQQLDEQDEVDPLYWKTPSKLRRAVEECEKREKETSPGTPEYEIMKADCGLGYELPKPDGVQRWQVSFIGEDWEDGIRKVLSGCPAACPLSPTCTLTFNIRRDDRADVLVAFVMNPIATSVIAQSKRYKVLYWREAKWDHPLYYDQAHKFSFEMGIHYWAGILNPTFLMRPSELLRGAYLNTEQKYFAVSVISDCGAPSVRDMYIRELEQHLGVERVHRYGKCGNRAAPEGRRFTDTLKIIAQYKFYFAFENTIQKGYVTEKLLVALALPVIPVYYGSPIVPNITATPAIVKVSDFSTTKQLAQYLLYLDSHPDAYAEYHSWRKLARPFSEEYLHIMQRKVPGPKETMLHHSNLREAACCRLCDPSYVKYATTSRNSNSYITPALGRREILRTYFGE